MARGTHPVSYAAAVRTFSRRISAKRRVGHWFSPRAETRPQNDRPKTPRRPAPGGGGAPRGSCRLNASLRRLAILLEEQRGLLAAQDHALGDLALLDAVSIRHIVLDVEHRVFHDRPQAARSRLAPHRLVRDRAQRL